MKRVKPDNDFDGIHINHLKLIDERSLSLIVFFFNVCVTSNFSPLRIQQDVMRPNPRNELGEMESFDNYREVVVSSLQVS